MASNSGGSLKPGQRRRLAAEQAIYRKNYDNFRQVSEDCAKLCLKKGADTTFNTLAIQQYIGCQTNLSITRLEILCEVLGITNYKEFNEIYVAPRHRGEGDLWIGTNGNTVKDIDLGRLPDRL